MTVWENAAQRADQIVSRAELYGEDLASVRRGLALTLLRLQFAAGEEPVTLGALLWHLLRNAPNEDDIDPTDMEHLAQFAQDSWADYLAVHQSGE